MATESASVEVRARLHAALGDPARLSIVDALTTGDLSPGEIAALLDMPTNLVAHHLKVLQGTGLIVRSRSEGDRRRTYLRLVPAVLAGLNPASGWTAPRVVFVCTHNSARSQLAAALWAQRSSMPAASAGTRPAARVHPRAKRIARRHGLMLDGTEPRYVADVLDRDDLVVAVCDNAHEDLEGEPADRLHWSVPDPAPIDTDAAFEAAYVDLAGRVERLVPAVTMRSRDD